MDDDELAKDVGELLNIEVSVELLKKMVAIEPILDVRRRWGLGLLTDSESQTGMKTAMHSALCGLQRLKV